MDFWLSVVRSFSLCFVLTFFEGLNFPIYWPLLFFYFIVLVLVSSSDSRFFSSRDYNT